MKATKLVLVGFMLAIAYTCTTIAELPQAHAFPCSGGTGKEYCKGYHAGAVAADKQYSKGGLGGLTCPGGSVEYCNGWDKGYLDEANMLD